MPLVRAVPRETFADSTERDAWYTAPTEGLTVWLSTPNQLTVYDGSAWVMIAGTPTWTALTLTNGWTNTGSGYQAAEYCRVGDRVYLRGTITPGSTGSVAFTLPEGFRPPAALRRIGAQGSGGGASGVTITAAGAVLIAYTGSGGIGIDCDFSVTA